MPGKYTMLQNNTFLPARFRCMQTGVTWSPDMAVSTTIHGERDEVVFACQQRCQDTEGCKHFTVMFPSLCRLAGAASAPLPAESAISGPPSQDCVDDPLSESPMAHTFMRKFRAAPEVSAPPGASPLASVVGPAALAVTFALAAVMWQRRRSRRAAALPISVVDLEESLQLIQE